MMFQRLVIAVVISLFAQKFAQSSELSSIEDYLNSRSIDFEISVGATLHLEGQLGNKDVVACMIDKYISDPTVYGSSVYYLHKGNFSNKAEVIISNFLRISCNDFYNNPYDKEVILSTHWKYSGIGSIELNPVDTKTLVLPSLYVYALYARRVEPSYDVSCLTSNASNISNIFSQRISKSDDKSVQLHFHKSVSQICRDYPIKYNAPIPFPVPPISKMAKERLYFSIIIQNCIYDNLDTSKSCVDSHRSEISKHYNFRKIADEARSINVTIDDKESNLFKNNENIIRLVGERDDLLAAMWEGELKILKDNKKISKLTEQESLRLKEAARKEIKKLEAEKKSLENRLDVVSDQVVPFRA